MLPDADGMVIEVTFVPPEAVANTPVPDVLVRPTVRLVPVVIGVPATFSSVTVTGPRVALLFAVPLTGFDVITSWFGPMVSCWVSEVRPV